jgi:hypothetical protein
LRALASRQVGQWLVGIGAVSFAGVCVLLLLIPPAGGYETSLISAYPLSFWVLFTVGLVVAILLFFGSTVADDSRWWAGLGLLTANYGVFFFLPAHRGYYLYDRKNTDALGHLGMVREVLQTGATPDTFYPLEHMILTEFVMTGLSRALARYLFSFVFTILFVLSISVLLRRMTGDTRATGAGLCAAMPLVFANFQVRIHPAIFSFMFVPLLLFVVERFRDQHRWHDLIPFLMIGTAIMFFHPMTTALVILLLLSTRIIQYAYERIQGVQIRTTSPRLAVLLIPPTAAWYISFGRTKRALRDIILGVLQSTDGTITSDQLQRVSVVEFSPMQLAVRFLQKYGVVFVICVVAALFILTVVVRLRRRNSSYPEVLVAGQFLIGAGVSALFLNVYLIAFDPIRVSRYMIIMAVLATGLLAYRAIVDDIILRGISFGSVLTVLLVCAIVTAALLSTFVGTTYWANMHMTHSEYHGTEFILDNHDQRLDIYSQDLVVKMQWFVYGERDHYFPHPIGPNSRVPRHLGYDKNGTAAQTFGSAHVVTQNHDTRFYTAEYYTESQQRALFVYDQQDVARMRHDPTAHRVYNNGGFSSWLITNRTM